MTSLIAQDDRRVGQVGRLARLELRFAVRGGRTMLADAYAEPPFRVGRTFAEGDGLHMIMASSAPGVFGGDGFEQHIHVESGARVRLTSQSAMQVHPASDGRAATLRSRYVVDDGGALSCFWDPLIPFADSCLDQRFDIELSSGARLHWSDAFMAGREARGERWRFASLAHELRLTRDRALLYLERYRIEPSVDDVSARWRGACGCYFGSSLRVSEDAGTQAETLHRLLAEAANVDAAVDSPDTHLLAARLMSSFGPAFHAARAVLWSHGAEVAP